MKYAEVIFETGAKSVVSYDSLDELKAGLKTHHLRAINGEPGAPQNVKDRTALTESSDLYVDPADFDRRPDINASMNRPAERIKFVNLFDKHPADYLPVGNDGSSVVDLDTVRSLVTGMAGDNGQVNVNQLTQALRDETSPVHTLDQGRHASNFKMAPTEKLDMSFLEGAES